MTSPKESVSMLGCESPARILGLKSSCQEIVCMIHRLPFSRVIRESANESRHPDASEEMGSQFDPSLCLTQTSVHGSTVILPEGLGNFSNEKNADSSNFL